MPALCPFSYAVVRVVPHVDREEFLNAGIVVFCDEVGFLGARVALDEARLRAISADADVSLIRRHLQTFPLVCAGGVEAGPIGGLPLRERWQWLIAPRSTILQISPAHAGVCARPEEELERLLTRLVLPPSPAPSA